MIHEHRISQQRLAKRSSSLEIANRRLPGAVVAITRNGKLIRYKADGQPDPAKKNSMRLEAMLALASMTKPMAVVVGPILMELGRLPLQPRLTEYYPEFANLKVAVPTMTAHHNFKHRVLRSTSTIYIATHPGSPMTRPPTAHTKWRVYIPILPFRRQGAISWHLSKQLPSCRWRTNREGIRIRLVDLNRVGDVVFREMSEQGHASCRGQRLTPTGPGPSHPNYIDWRRKTPNSSSAL